MMVAYILLHNISCLAAGNRPSSTLLHLSTNIGAALSPTVLETCLHFFFNLPVCTNLYFYDHSNIYEIKNIRLNIFTSTNCINVIDISWIKFAGFTHLFTPHNTHNNSSFQIRLN